MKNFLIRLLLVFLFPAAAHSVHAQSGAYCIENRFSESSYFELSDLSVTRSVVYSVVRRWPGNGVDTLKMDVYSPDTLRDPLTSRPAILFMHGGAWLLGNRADAGIQQKCVDWAKRGFVVASVSYRLGWNCKASDLPGVCVLCQGNYFDMNTAVYRGAQDAHTAMRWLVANSKRFRIDTSALFAGGESAGAFNALHMAYWSPAYARIAFNGGPYKILGALDSSGWYPGLKFRIRGVINNCGAVLNDAKLYFPKTPVVSFHDAADCVVPYRADRVLNCCATSFFYARGSKLIHDEQTAASVPSELHTMQGVTPQHCSYPSLTMVQESSCFIKKLLCGMNPGGEMDYPAKPSVSCASLKSSGVKEMEMQRVKLWPNPTNHTLNLEGDILRKEQEITLYDLSGRV
ncbi:MAG: alpha/beta hydrolase, partial [Bacteroidetes bacterium]|nr:alpha/beta hydrolase [Bacteroidota bacterium]